MTEGVGGWFLPQGTTRTYQAGLVFFYCLVTSRAEGPCSSIPKRRTMGGLGFVSCSNGLAKTYQGTGLPRLVSFLEHEIGGT